MRVGVLMAVLLLAACAGASPSSAPGAVRILASDLLLIEGPFTVAVIDNATDFEAGWARSSASGPPPVVSFATEVVVYLGMAGSSSCPETFQHLVVDAEAAHVYGEWDSSQFVGKPCSDDLRSQGVVLAVRRTVLPPTEFTLTLRAELICPDCPDHPDRVLVDLP
jgi:hypothetical protein